MNGKNFIAIALFIAIIIVSCTEKKSIIKTEHEDSHSLFETIEHAAIHMADGPSKIVIADSVKPGPHLDPDSISHTRLDVVLRDCDTLKGGYVHFGPNAEGDRLVMISAPARIRFINRRAVGDGVVDSLLEIEEIISESAITDSTGITSIKKAFLFEAQIGGNILCIDSASVDTLRIVIEETEHSHE